MWLPESVGFNGAALMWGVVSVIVNFLSFSPHSLVREGGSDVANSFMSHHPPATHMPAVGLCQPSVAVADRAPLLQMVPAPPNTTAAHTDSQPQRDNRDIMRVGCDKT